MSEEEDVTVSPPLSPKAHPGNQHAKKGAKWSSAIRRALVRNEDSLNKAASALVKAAVAGDMKALKELGDRLDGKSKQSVDMTSNGKPMFPSVIRVSSGQ